MLVLASASPRRRELLTQAGYSFQVIPANIPEDPLPKEDPVAYVVRLARQKAEAVYRELALKGHDFSRAENDAQAVRALAPEGCSSKDFTFTPASLPRASAPPRVVLGADTTVVLDNQILGKPENPADAARMLRLLSGRTHRVITGVAVVTAAQTRVAAETTNVTFLDLTEEEIAAYIATGEPIDKAGAYAIQGRAARFIPRIEGDYSNVVGLPLVLVSTLLDAPKT